MERNRREESGDSGHQALSTSYYHTQFCEIGSTHFTNEDTEAEYHHITAKLKGSRDLPRVPWRV